MLALIVAVALTAQPAYPGGIEVHRSECASGDWDWFFFADGTVVADCWGCEARPRVKWGRWRRDGAEIRVRVIKEWSGIGRGRVTTGAHVDVWEDYIAIVRTADPELTLESEHAFSAGDFTGTPDDTCAFPRKHERSPDPHAFLRQFDGEHPETYQRVLEPSEIGRIPAEQLRAMRNEVFARYGYRFKDPALSARFAKVEGYEPHLSNVDDFMSDTERENVKRLLAAEEASRRK